MLPRFTPPRPEHDPGERYTPPRPTPSDDPPEDEGLGPEDDEGDDLEFEDEDEDPEGEE